MSGGSSSSSSQPAPQTAEELELTRINVELGKRQLANLDQLQPFQRELLDLTLADLRRQGVETAALDAAITPERRAALAKSEFERTERLGPIQDELLTMQLEELRRGGAASPEQLARIREATERGIEAGSGDIDIQTGRGIGLIADDLANSRGLRLTDSPISREAAFLARSGEDQKASLIKNLRAGEATAALNYPLAVQQVQSGINLNQQSIASSAQNFQNELRQRAYQNRLALSGQTGQIGIGISSIRGPELARRGTTGSSSGRSFDLANTVQGVGGIAAGIGAAGAFFSDRRLKHDYGVVAKTDSGIDLHLYHFKGEDARDPLRLGPMADEVAKVKPWAVKTHSSGYKVVDYAGL